jgi:hypothetical protein
MAGPAEKGGGSVMNNRIKKKPLRIRRSIKAGIRIGVLILAAMTIVEIAKLAWETYQSRTGAPGGEILVLPMMILLFYTGWTARGEWAEFKRAFREAERREYHASNSPAYKG